MGILTSALAPTNTLLGNPAAIKKTFEAGGGNLVSGVENFAHDVRHNGGMPSMAKPGALKVGEDLAVTPGQVVDRDEFAELIQYAPATATVRERPMLVVPPPIGRYYFLDLRPGRSFVEYAVEPRPADLHDELAQPGARAVATGTSTPTPSASSARSTRSARSPGRDDVNVIGFCAGGILQHRGPQSPRRHR